MSLSHGIEAPAAKSAVAWTRLMAEWDACAADLKRTRAVVPSGDSSAESEFAGADDLQAAMDRADAVKARIGACIDDALLRRPAPVNRPLAIVNLALPEHSPRTRMAGLFRRIFLRKES